MPNFVVTSLPAYVQENRDLLLKNFGFGLGLGLGTRQRVSIQTGIKKSAYINFMEVDPTLQDGAACAFDADGTVTLTQRVIETGAIKVNMDICPKTLRGKYAEYLIRMNATEETLPFEAFIMEGITHSINNKIEKLAWQGDTTSADTDLKWADGWLKIALAETDVVDVAIAAGTDAYDAILAVYNAMTEEALDRNPEIYVSPAVYRAFMQDLVAKNYFHYAGAVDAAPAEFILPGTDVKVVKTLGLKGTNYVVGTFPKNLYYGTDMEGDEEDIKVWFSDDDDVYKLKVLWNSGMQIAFPEHVALGTIATA